MVRNCRCPGKATDRDVLRASSQLACSHATDSGHGGERKKADAVGNMQASMALENALLGFTARSQQGAEAALRYDAEDAALAFTLTGNTTQASNLSKRLASRATSDTFFREIRLPELLGVIEIKRGSPTKAIELLAPVKRYEEGWMDNYWAAYLRGQAYLAARQGSAATLEFQKVVDYRGLVLILSMGRWLTRPWLAPTCCRAILTKPGQATRISSRSRKAQTATFRCCSKPRRSTRNFAKAGLGNRLLGLSSHLWNLSRRLFDPLPHDADMQPQGIQQRLKCHWEREVACSFFELI
jgi:hypothetical protein